MKLVRLGLRARFILFVLAGVGLVSGTMALAAFWETRNMSREAALDKVRCNVQLQAEKLSRSLNRVAQKPLDMAVALEVVPPQTEEDAFRLIEGFLKTPPMVYGMAVAYPPYTFRLGLRFFAPYVHWEGGGLRRVNLDSPSYNYPLQDWYLVTALTDKPVWSEPYYDEGGANAVMTTISVPVRKGKILLAVATADVVLENLGREVSLLAAEAGGWAFVVSRAGTFLAAPEEEWVMRETVFSLAEALKRPDLRKLGRAMVAGESGLESIKDWRDGSDAWLAYCPVGGAGWSFGAVVSENRIKAPAVALAKQQGFHAILGLAAMIGVVLLLVITLTKPLKRLAAGVRRVAAGDLSTRVEGVPPGDELGQLAADFNRMVDDLNHYVDELTHTTAAKERIESELDLARQIQESILPNTYPAYPGRKEFDVFGRTHPARQVGGDFYDYFLVDDDHLGLVVGDVSGKGVPSALFMTVARTLVKNAAVHYLDPARVLDETNRQIVPENDMCMFVTLFYGVYQISTGRLTYSTAGHPAPLLRRAGGQVAPLPQTGGMALGVYPEPDLGTGMVEIGLGDLLMIYTDGLDEAIDPDTVMFGLDRTLEWLAQIQDAPGPELLESLMARHKEFTRTAEQFDDLTLLFLRRRA